MPKKLSERVRNWLVKKMDLPHDVMMDLPRITMIGQLHVYIENHRGLISFTDDELRLMLKNGQLLIKGSSFVIKTILPEEIILEGKIDQVLYIN